MRKRKIETSSEKTGQTWKLKKQKANAAGARLNGRVKSRNVDSLSIS